ncbi:MAG: MDR family MFS transporter, partial [Sciscionella sp.]
MTTTAAAASPAASAQSGPSHTGGLTHRQILVVLSGLMLGMFLAALDQTIVSTSIRVIADQLHGLDLQAWATTAYLITSTISTPLYGKLSDQYGRKPFFLFAIAIFVVGSAASAFSTSMYMMAAFRAVQGVGAGGIMSLALTIIADIVPPRQRAKYQGYFLAVFGTSSVAGPVLGGLLAGQQHIWFTEGWRWVFLVNVPIGILAFFVVMKVLNLSHTPNPHRIDWPGALALIVGLVPLLIIAEQGRTWGWDSGRAFLCYGVGVLGLIGFYLAERAYKSEALVPLKLFRSSVFTITCGGGLLVGVAMFGAIAMLPQYLQIVRDASPTKSGFLMLPFVLGMMVFSILSGQLTSRTGRYKIFPLIGTALMAVAAVLFWQRLNADTSLVEVDAYMFMFGAGLGFCMQTLTLAAQNAVPARDVGVGTSTSTTFRQLGGTLGTAIFISLLFSTVGGKIGAAFTSASKTQVFQAAVNNPQLLAQPNNKPIVALLQHGGAGGNASGVLQDSAFIQKLSPVFAHPFKVGFSNS